MKKDLVGSIYKERPPKEREKRGGQKHKVIQLQGRLNFRDGHQDKDPLGYIEQNIHL